LGEKKDAVLEKVHEGTPVGRSNAVMKERKEDGRKTLFLRRLKCRWSMCGERFYVEQPL
jgi:hypothetical protein